MRKKLLRSRSGCLYNADKQYITGKKYNSGRASTKIAVSLSSQETAKYIRFSWYRYNDASYDDVSKIMLNTGSTAIPYEPYGVKIPILSANTTTPIYLGEVETTRKIKKFVLNGTENWRSTSGRMYLDALSDDYMRASGVITCICTHYSAQEQVGSASRVNEGCITLGSDSSNQRLYVYDTNISTAADFKTYLQQQYAAGTPVTVWYVLATETTGIVNEPLMKICDYADSISKAQAGVEIPTVNGSNTLDVDTTLKPSNIYIEYK